MKKKKFYNLYFSSTLPTLTQAISTKTLTPKDSRTPLKVRIITEGEFFPGFESGNKE